MIEVNGLKVHVKTMGQGEPVFLLLHGFGASLYSWHAVMEPLSRLGRIGVSQFLNDYDTDQSTEANVCRVFYESARDRVLQDLPWNFATRTAPLVETCAI